MINKSVIITGYFLILFWIVVLFTALTTIVRENPIRPSLLLSYNTITLLPQGWSFFTRNPREENYYVYEYLNNEWKLYNVPNFHVDNLFGIKRISRAMAMEIQSLVAQIPDSLWTSFSESSNHQVDTLNSFEVVNYMKIRPFVGCVMIQKREPTPWAWVESNIRMPTKFVVLNVKQGHIKNGSK